MVLALLDISGIGWITSQCSRTLPSSRRKMFHHRLAAGIIGQAVPMAVKNDVVAVGKDTLDLAASIRMRRQDPGKELLQALDAVFDQRIVLAIGGPRVKPEGIFDPAFEHRHFVEGDSDVFVGLGHGLSPWSEHRVGVGGGSGSGWILSQFFCSLSIAEPSAQTGCFNAVVSIGSFRKRLPVAAKIALATAGAIAEVPASPIPPGGSALRTMWTSIAGVSLIRRT